MILVATTPAIGQESFIAFESGQVRPLALSPDGERLFVLNTPDGALEIFGVDDSGLHHQISVPVGLEPVAVAARNQREVWVVNHLSDSVSVVDVVAEPPRVVRTLLVGDEPRDIVFAGTADRRRAFITTAHRGQHRTHPSIAQVPGAGDPQLTTPGVPRADVWVFDAGDLGDALGGTPVKIVELFGDTSRALAVSPDGGTVYMAVFYSGNQTTTVHEELVCDGFEPDRSCVVEVPVKGGEPIREEYPGGNAGPKTNYQHHPAPEVGLIVKLDRETGKWQDELGRDWSKAVRFHLPDYDVFALDAGTLQTVEAYPHVGTTLFNMAVNPVSGAVYVSNTDAHNEIRFEGPGKFGGTTVQGRAARSQITVLDAEGVKPRHLNKHIDYERRPAPPEVKEHSLSTPLGMAVSADGSTLYVAAFGSSKIGVFSTEALTNDRFDPTRASRRYLEVSGGGPSGLALDEARGRLYVLTRFDNAVSVLDLEAGVEMQHLRFFNPEPAHVVKGRPFLYDAVYTSANGEASCASCHPFGDMDHLAWDLGDPDEELEPNHVPIRLEESAEVSFPNINGTGKVGDLHPMKGPMTTQTLRGLVNAGAQHWRGDRADEHDPFDADLAFQEFNEAFRELVGRTAVLAPEEIAAFSAFAMELTMPPNPIRSLDGSLTESEAEGRHFYFQRFSDGSDETGVAHTCHGCHTLAPGRGFFGTDGRSSFDGVPQIIKTPHLRNMYQKVGMFGNPAVPKFLPGDNEHMGDQVRGFGFLHDGSVDTVLRFFRGRPLNPAPEHLPIGFADEGERRDMEQFMLAFDSDLPPIVGQQITQRDLDPQVRQRIDLLVRSASKPYPSKLLGPDARECDLVVRGVVEGQFRGWLYDPSKRVFQGDLSGELPLTRRQLQELSRKRGQALTYSCVPYGSGERMALDRDQDGVLNRDEREGRR